MGLTIGEYLITIIFDIKSEIGIFEISNMSNFNKFRAFLRRGKYFIKIIFHII